MKYVDSELLRSLKHGSLCFTKAESSPDIGDVSEVSTAGIYHGAVYAKDYHRQPGTNINFIQSATVVFDYIKKQLLLYHRWLESEWVGLEVPIK